NLPGSSFWSASRQSRPITKIVVHSTETVGLPGYRNGADCPHITVDLESGLARQHIPLTHGARALEVRGTLEANTGGVVQIEVIGACTPGYPTRYGHYDLVGRFPNDERAQYHLARVIRALHDAT